MIVVLTLTLNTKGDWLHYFVEKIQTGYLSISSLYSEECVLYL